MNDAQDRESVVPIPTDGFFSKWGFEDGDILDDALYEMGWGDAYQTKGMDFDHDVLVAVLRAFTYLAHLGPREGGLNLA